MRSCVELSKDKDHEALGMIRHYEIIASVIQKSLAKIVDKQKKDIALTDGDRVTGYELSLTFHVLVSQVNNFEWYDNDLLQQHLKNEQLIRHYHKDF